MKPGRQVLDPHNRIVTVVGRTADEALVSGPGDGELLT